MYKKGDILLINFPFSDFKQFKLRPVLLWEDRGNDILVMPITSNNNNLFGNYILYKDDINNLKVDSYIKPFNINTVDKSIIKGKLGEVISVDLEKIQKIVCDKFCK